MIKFQIVLPLQYLENIKKSVNKQVDSHLSVRILLCFTERIPDLSKEHSWALTLFYFLKNNVFSISIIKKDSVYLRVNNHIKIKTKYNENISIKLRKFIY